MGIQTCGVPKHKRAAEEIVMLIRKNNGGNVYKIPANKRKHTGNQNEHI